MVKFFTTGGKFSFVKVGAQLLVLSALVLGVVAFTGSNKSVTLNVDGKVSSVQTFGNTVDQVVKAAKVDLKAEDRVSPALDASVQNGSIINVNLAKAVTVSLDGAQRTVNTTAPNVEGLVSELGVASASAVSQPKDTQLAVSGSFVSIMTPKTISLIVDGQSSAKTTTAADVGTVLSDAGVVLGPNDRVSQPNSAPVVQNMVVKVSRVDTSKTATETENVPFDTVTTQDPAQFTDQKTVTREGVLGLLSKKFKLILVDGREASRTLVSSDVTVNPVSAKVTVGTMERPKPAAAGPVASGPTGAPNEAMWDKVAQCESGGNWAINTGNGYYGGLQFDIQTWIGSGGGAYAPNAAAASKAQQIDIANRVYAQRGLSPWGCGWAASR